MRIGQSKSVILDYHPYCQYGWSLPRCMGPRSSLPETEVLKDIRRSNAFEYPALNSSRRVSNESN